MSKIVRTSRDTPFFMADKYGFNDPDLSWKAKGILGYILSKPDNWKIYLADLVKHAKDGRDATSSGVNELIESGYILRKRLHDEGGKFQGYDYLVFERPMGVEDDAPIPNATSVGNTVYGKSVNGSSDYGKPDTTNNEVSNNEVSNIFSSSFAETHPKLYARLKSKKRGLEFIEHIIKVVDHFREVTGKGRTAYHTGGPLKYMLKWFKEGYTVEDVKLVIDYKTWYFTEKNPEPENISLATYLRFEKFESNLENALTWKDAGIEAEESAPDPPTESELTRYRLIMEYWDRCELSSSYTLTIEEFVQLVRGKSESKVVQKYANNESWVNTEIRNAMNRLVSNNILSASAQNRSLKPLIEKNIDIYYAKTFK